MAKRPRRDLVENIIKALLDSEIPEIQAQAKKLAEQIKKLEEHGHRLQEYIVQLESLTSEEASAVVESKINELLSNLDNALNELRKRSKKIIPSAIETKARGTVTEAPAEVTPSKEPERRYEEEEVVLPRSAVGVEKYITPEGFVIRKTRR
jgi:division protein CdvB (Snf7/Vps24/ESCRT-III family)